MKPATRNRALIEQLKHERGKISPGSPTTPPVLAPPPSTVTAPAPSTVTAPAPVIDPAAAPTDSAAENPPAPPPALPHSPSPAPAEFASVSSASSAADGAWPPLLTAQLGKGRWTRAGLLNALADVLPPDYPAIYFRAEVICSRGIYRNVKRSRDGTVVRIEHPQGAWEFAPYATSRAVRIWLAHFSRHRSADPQRAAIRMSCADLVKSLTSFEDFQRATWTKKIDPASWHLINT